MLSTQPVYDSGPASPPWTVTAYGGVTYDGTALAFDGQIGSYVSLGSSVTFGPTFSFSVWAKYASFGSCNGAAYPRVLDFSSAPNTAGFLLCNNACSSQVLLGYGGHSGDFGSATWTLGAFTHVVIACDSTQPSTICVPYVDGVAFSWDHTPSLTSTTYSYTTGLGRSAYGGDAWFTGDISDVRQFSFALTQDQVTALFTGATCGTPHPPPSPPPPPPAPPPPPPPPSPPPPPPSPPSPPPLMDPFTVSRLACPTLVHRWVASATYINAPGSPFIWQDAARLGDGSFDALLKTSVNKSICASPCLTAAEDPDGGPYYDPVQQAAIFVPPDPTSDLPDGPYVLLPSVQFGTGDFTLVGGVLFLLLPKRS